MAEFKISLQKTFAHEGEYVNDPNDSGKETYRGISRANHGNWDGWFVVDQYKIKSNFPFNLAKLVDLAKQVELFYASGYIRLNFMLIVLAFFIVVWTSTKQIIAAS